MITDEDRKFGQLLLERSVLTKSQLVDVLRLKKHQDEDLTQLIISKGWAEPRDVFCCLADALDIPFVDLKDYTIDPGVLDLVSPDLAVKYKVFPVFKIEDTLTVAMADPSDVHALDTLRRETGLEIEPAISVASEIELAVANHYKHIENLDSSFDEVIQNIENQHKQEKEDSNASAERLKQLSAETPVVKLVNLIISRAIIDRASDIHIEPEENSLQVRYRIDGVLHEHLSPPKHLQPAIISRLKILSDLDIAESRIPQDGRFQVKLSGREVDLRVSTLPTVYGENVVMRILDKNSLVLNLEDLGFQDYAYRQFRRMLDSAYGIILVSGPTGSGKTTTLYSALQSINTPDKNIITVEDPVEYRLKRIRQSQVNVKAGLTFATGLRSILRQDPDVIMVGEIRDSETAEIAVESALTGHLVLSTIHTNDAPGGLTRLTEMGVEPFLSASATIGIVAQRLVRKICDQCKTPYKPNPTVLSDLEIEPDEASVFHRGKGCENCKNTGYKGRVGIYEIMILNDEIRELTLNHASTDKIKKAAENNGMVNLRQDAVHRARQGITSLEEVFRVTNA